jgi:hypothetical protein
MARIERRSRVNQNADQGSFYQLDEMANATTVFHTKPCITVQRIFADLSLGPLAKPKQLRRYSRLSISIWLLAG